MNKSFSSKNPAMAFITARNTEDNTQDNTQRNAQFDTLEKAQDSTQYIMTEETTSLKVTPQTDPYGDRQIVRKKGNKLPRINMAFTNENLEYLQVMSTHLGMSQTEYVNRLLAVDRQENIKVLKQAKRKSKA